MLALFAGTIAVICAALGGVALVTVQQIWRASRAARPVHADAIVVFGAAVWPSGPSPTLRRRTEHAATLYRRGFAPRVVLSGGGAGSRSEPAAMAGMMRALGVPDEALVLDEAGVTTRATLRSVARLGAGGWSRIVVVSSPSHVFRIVEEARRQGIEATPSPAPRAAAADRATGLRHLAWDVHQYAREVAAVWAYRLDGRRLDPLKTSLRRAMPRLRRELSHRWSSFSGGADAVRRTSIAIWAAIRSDATPEERPPSSLPRLSWPVAGRVISAFGMRHGRLHEGIDIPQPLGTPVRPALPGTVLLASELAGYGKLVVLDHAGPLATVYAHLATIDVAPGERVGGERRVGTVGVTGHSTGPHLHFEVRYEGTAIDPLVLLDADQAEVAASPC
jgi:murein DD-endopeptidase MepM/ murein hydrolase activator NlpD